jgi:hypothetical protein
MADVDETSPEAVIDLIMKEQLMETLSPELECLVRDHGPQTAFEVADLVEKHSRAKWETKSKRPASEGVQKVRGPPEKPNTPSAPRDSKSLIDKQCFFGKEKGHLKRDCPKMVKNSCIGGRSQVSVRIVC